MRNIELKKNGDLVYLDHINEVRIDDDILMPFLHSDVYLQDGVTLRSVFKMLSRYELLAKLEPWIPHLLSDIEELPELGCNDPKLSYLEVGARIDVTSKSKTPKMRFGERDKESGFVRAHFDYIDEPYRRLNQYYTLSGRVSDDDESYSLSMTPLREILDLRIIMGKSRVIVSQDDSDFEDFFDMQIPLGQLIVCIISEITFFGTEQQKENQKIEIEEIAKKVEVNIEKRNARSKLTLIDGGKGDEE